MSSLVHATRFSDLVVYQKARAVAQRIFELTKGFPREEAYSLTADLFCGEPDAVVREEALGYVAGTDN